MDHASQTSHFHWHQRLLFALGSIFLAGFGAAVTVIVPWLLGDPTQHVHVDVRVHQPHLNEKPAVRADAAPVHEFIPEPKKQDPPVIPQQVLRAGGVTVSLPAVLRRDDLTQYPVEGDPTGVAWLIIVSRNKGSVLYYVQDVHRLLAQKETVKFTWPSAVKEVQLRMGIIDDADSTVVPQLNKRFTEEEFEALTKNGTWSNTVDVSICP